MTIRSHHALNPNHAVHSADVLTAPERYVQRQRTVPREPTPIHGQPLRWGDVPAIRSALEQLRGRT